MSINYRDTHFTKIYTIYIIIIKQTSDFTLLTTFVGKMAAPEICVICRKNITKKVGSVKCSICLNWIHRKLCSELSENSYKFLLKQRNAMQWKCPQCQAFSLKQTDTDKKLDELCAKLDNIQTTIPTIIKNEIKKEIESNISSIKQLIETRVRATLDNNIDKLEKENYQLQHQLCRNDIIVRGLPKSAKPLDTICKIGSIYDVNIEKNDINSCFWLGKDKKVILVKFCSTIKRDELMQKYFLNLNLRLKQVIPYKTSSEKDSHTANSSKNNLPADIDPRIYLNDNLPPTALKIKLICRKLVKNKKIKSYKLIGALPAAKVTFSTGSQKMCNINDLQEFLISNSSANTEHNKTANRRGGHYRRGVGRQNKAGIRHGRGNSRHPDVFGTPECSTPNNLCATPIIMST